MAVSYDLIKPLIVSEELRGNSMYVTFRCPITGAEFSSSGGMQEGVASRAKRQVQRNIWNSLRSSVARSISSALGHGVVGRTASSMIYGTSSNVGSQASFSKGDQQAAVVAAFERVQRNFIWDDISRRFVAAGYVSELQTEFSSLLQKKPVANPWDKGVLSRMLAEIAAADGVIEPEERYFFRAFMGEDASIDEILRKPQLTQAELQETSQNVRETMLMLAFAVAFSDQDLDRRELERLNTFGQMFGLQQSRIAQLASYAQEHIVDQLLDIVYADGEANSTERAQVEDAARKMGIEPVNLAKLDARCRKRRGIY